MLTSIRVASRRDSNLFVDIPLSRGAHSVWANSLATNARRNRGFFLKESDGLGPVKSDVSYDTYAVLDGGVQTGSALQARNIVLNIGVDPFFEDGQTHDSLRNLLYLAAGPQEDVLVSFFEDEQRTKYIHGHVESLEPELFARDPGFQLSIICVEPDILDVFQNSLTVTGDQWFEIDYVGTRPAGFFIDTLFDVARNQITYRRQNDMSELAVHATVAANQRLVLNSQPNSKRVELRSTANLVQRRLFNDIQDDPVWPTLYFGMNTYRILSNGTTSPYTTTVSYRSRYSGL